MSLVTSPTLRGRAQSLPEWDAYKSYNYLDMNFGFGRGVKLLDKSPFHSDGDITTAAWADGLHHRCLDFTPGIPDYVEVTCPQCNFISESFSLITRIRIDDLTAGRQFFCRGLFETDGWYFETSATGALYVSTNQSGERQLTASAVGAIVTATWYTLGLSRSGANVIIYKNGIDLEAGTGAHINPATCARTAKIGIYDNKVSVPFDGKMEFLRVFGDIALPAEAHLWFHNILK